MISPDAKPAPQSGREPALQHVLDAYVAAISEIAAAVSAIDPEMSSAYQVQLSGLKERLSFQPDVPTIEQSRSALHDILVAFSGQARRRSQALTDDLNQTLAMVARSENSRSVRSVRYVEHLIDFVDQMEEAVKSANLDRLVEQARELRQFAESIELDSRDDYAQLRDKLDQFQHRLREAELLAARDPLTGVANRRELERQIASRIASHREFCVLMFDLNRFKSINDQFGHLCGDEVLKQVAARLGGQVRSRDLVCRWGGDEFVVVLDCALDNAVARSRQITRWLDGDYSVEVEGEQTLVNVCVSAGVAEYLPDEAAEQLFRRVDESLYAEKRKTVAR